MYALRFAESIMRLPWKFLNFIEKSDGAEQAKRESEHVHVPVTAGVRQIFLGYRFFQIFIEKFYLTDCNFRFINIIPIFIKTHIFY